MFRKSQVSVMVGFGILFMIMVFVFIAGSIIIKTVKNETMEKDFNTSMNMSNISSNDTIMKADSIEKKREMLSDTNIAPPELEG